MTQMFIDGGLADYEAKGNLTEGEPIAEVQFSHVTTD